MSTWPSPKTSWRAFSRSEEHTSELQSQSNLVCRLLLEKKKEHQHPMKVSNPDLVIKNLTSLKFPTSSPGTSPAQRVAPTPPPTPPVTTCLPSLGTLRLS